MRKKLLVSFGIVGGLLLLVGGGIVYAEGLEEALKAYLADPSLDWLGRGYDKILFEDIKSVSTGNLNDAEFFAKLKFVVEDIKTMPLQFRCMGKIITQKPNAIAYGLLGNTAGLKLAIGAREFNKIAIKMLKLVVK